MIKVSIKYENDRIKEISIKGHALYDDFGKDIVCASVSSIVTTTVNAILLICGDDAINYDTSFKITILEENATLDKLIINMINLLKELEHDYPKNIKFL